MRVLAADPAEWLRSAGPRVTGPRVGTVQELAAHPHAPLDDVAAAALGQLGAVSTQAIYDALRACVASGIVRRIEPAGSPALYELRVGGNHHHLICRECRTVEDVGCVAGTTPLPGAVGRSRMHRRRSRGRLLGHLPVLCRRRIPQPTIVTTTKE